MEKSRLTCRAMKHAALGVLSLVFWTACSSNDLENLKGVDSGMPVGTGELVLSTQLIDFGNVIARTEHARAFMVTNNTPNAVQFKLQMLSGEAFFKASSDEVQVLGAGQTGTYQVIYSSTVLMQHEGTLGIDACASGCLKTITLRARAVNTAISCDPMLDFGMVPAGECRTENVRCSNEGSTGEPF